MLVYVPSSYVAHLVLHKLHFYLDGAARNAAEVDVSAFNGDMAPSSSLLSSILKRGRDSPIDESMERR